MELDQATITQLFIVIIALITAFTAWLQSKTHDIAVSNAAKIGSIDTAQTAQMTSGTQPAGTPAINTATIVEATPVVQGKWSDAAVKAMEKAVPAGATITGTYDDEYAHIVYWTV